MAGAFEYPKLPEEASLRLLTLKPGEFFDDLEGELVATPFSSKPKYITLSSAWDDPAPDQVNLPTSYMSKVRIVKERRERVLVYGHGEAPISLNGHGFPIQPNLTQALRYIRSTSLPLVLWVDAICINQADIDELNSQVVLKPLIFRRAVAATAWLGLKTVEILAPPLVIDEDGCTEWSKGMMMREAYEQGNSKELASWFEKNSKLCNTEYRTPLEQKAVEDEALERLAAANGHGDNMVTESGYWQRSWAVQEICLTKRVFFMYGPTLFLSESAVREVYSKRQVKMTKHMENILAAHSERFSESMRLEPLIEKFAGQRCTNTRDKIYGLVGLANDVNAISTTDSTKDKENKGEDVDFIIDYRRSFYSIWCDTILYYFQCPYYKLPANHTNQDKLERLHHLQLTRLVRFAALLQNTLLDEVERELVKLTRAAGWPWPSSTPISDSDMNTKVELRGPRLFGDYLVPARGYLAGKIISMGPTYDEFVGSPRQQIAWTSQWRKYYAQEHQLQLLREMEERYAAKILGYTEAELKRIAGLSEWLFVGLCSPEPGPIDKLAACSTDADARHVMSEMLEPLPNLMLQKASGTGEWDKTARFLGTDHCMGLAPPDSEVGDWVVRFWGCNAAIIVRPNVNAGQKSCALIGRADVADIYEHKQDNDKVADESLYPISTRGEKWIDMVMSWHTLQCITAAATT
ncbi:heterokaryon incompatibility protein-domain-containing protein [Xylaria sp. CBS 124048]|nr:heterokaryon incompatibility protein-domain-containing protein [Xylaria sp. CBS 124048]